MSGTASSSPTNNTFSLAASPEVLRAGHSVWGILECQQTVDGGLVAVRISGQEILVDDSLYPILSGLVGRAVTVGHIVGKWQAGAMST
jgi:hypothetical protein